MLPVFDLLQRLGKIEEAEMFRTFNMGIGMVVVCARSEAQEIKSMSTQGDSCYEIGRIVEGDQRVSLV